MAAKKTTKPASTEARPDPRAETVVKEAPPTPEEVRAAHITCGMSQEQIDAAIRKLRGVK